MEKGNQKIDILTINIKKTENDTIDRMPACNSGFASGGVSASADTFVVSQNSFSASTFSVKFPSERKAANRYWQ